MSAASRLTPMASYCSAPSCSGLQAYGRRPVLAQKEAAAGRPEEESTVFNRAVIFTWNRERPPPFVVE